MDGMIAGRIAWLRARIATLDDERERLAAEVMALTAPLPALPPAGPVAAMKTPAGPTPPAPEEKVGLFLSLFRGCWRLSECIYNTGELKA